VNIKQVVAGFKSRVHSVDWALLVFLVFFLNVKLVVKAAALVFIFVLRPNFKFGVAIKNSRLPFFYLLVIAIAAFNWVISGMMTNFNYNLVLATGLCFWIITLLAVHQIKLSVEKNDPPIIHRTIVLFFIINALVSLLVYAGIVLETGAINAYRYQGDYQKYFIGTGDYIKGISFDTSTTNAVLSAFGVIYFLLKGNNLMTVLCMAVLLLASSNITNLMLFSVLIFLFFFQSSKIQKSVIIICIVMTVTFLIKISPQNNNYVVDGYRKFFNLESGITKKTANNIPIAERPDSTLTEDEKKQKIAQLYLDSIAIVSLKEKRRAIPQLALIPVRTFIEKPKIPGDSIHTPAFQYRRDTSADERILLQFRKTNNGEMAISPGNQPWVRLPGKLIAMQQTAGFYKQNPAKILTGTGIGNFSSKLAFRATAMNIAGGYPQRFRYISGDFKANHLDLYLFYFTNNDNLHSIINTPNSTYDQLISEYGLAGLLSFFGFYLFFFAGQMKKQTYAIPLFLFILGVFFIEYWFEQLSVIIIFELLIFLSIKEQKIKNSDAIN
jgi:hypothetical protein